MGCFNLQSASWTESSWFIMKCGFCDSPIIPSVMAYGALLAYFSSLKGKEKLDLLHHFVVPVCVFVRFIVRTI
jgi:hypothetical protein